MKISSITRMSTTFPMSVQPQRLMGRQLQLLTWTTKTKKTSRAFIQLASGTFSCVSCSIVESNHSICLLLCRDFLLKPELLRAISDLGFEHPSEGSIFP